MPARPPRYAAFEGLSRADAVDEVVAWLAGVSTNTALLGSADPHPAMRELLDGLELR